jgi:hypothetical protein
VGNHFHVRTRCNGYGAISVAYRHWR